MDKDKYIGVFENEESFDMAVASLKNAHVEIEEIYAPIPVHTAVRSMTGRSKLPTLAYFLGILSLLATLSFLYYTAVIDWPLNIGGKPSNAFPSFIVVTLVITIFSVTILSLLAFSVSAKLYPGKKAVVMHDQALDDKFIIVLSTDKVAQPEDILKKNGATEVILHNRQST